MILWKHKMQFWRTRRKFFDKKLTLFSSKSKCDKKTIFLPKTFSFSALVPQTRKLRFWQPHWSVSGIMPKIPHSKSEKMKKLIFFFRKVFFFEMFLLKHRNQFWQPRRICFGTNEFFLLARFTNMFPELPFFQEELLLLQNVPKDL